MSVSSKTAAALSRRIKEFDDRASIARGAPGGEKIVPMMHRPGSQNRKKGYSNTGPTRN